MTNIKGKFVNQIITNLKTKLKKTLCRDSTSPMWLSRLSRRIKMRKLYLRRVVIPAVADIPAISLAAKLSDPQLALIALDTQISLDRMQKNKKERSSRRKYLHITMLQLDLLQIALSEQITSDCSRRSQSDQLRQLSRLLTMK